MSEVTRHAPGSFCWVELATTDIAAAKKFYPQLFGWETEDTPIGGGATYTIARVRGRDVGGLYQLSPEQRSQGIPPHWLSYVAVSSADETAKKVPALGGTILMPPFDVMEHGRMAVVQDPTNATFALWQPNKHIGSGVVNEPGATCWNELVTKHAAAARRFYTSLFGWTTRDQDMGSMTYTLFVNGTAETGGMMPMSPEWGDVPSHWLAYFAVDDCDGRAEAASMMGGVVRVEPTDIPDVGRFAILQDAQGGGFAILQPARAA